MIYKIGPHLQATMHKLITQFDSFPAAGVIFLASEIQMINMAPCIVKIVLATVRSIPRDTSRNDVVVYVVTVVR